jgi:hypothetical protein
MHLWFLYGVLLVYGFVNTQTTISFTDSTAIDITGKGYGSSNYNSSNITVSGVPSNVTGLNVRVQINNLTHSNMHSVVLWVQKDNVSVYLNINMPSTSASINGTLIYDESGADTYNVTNSVLVPGAYRPQTNLNPTGNCAASPNPSVGTNLSDFLSLASFDDWNGDWTLRVADECTTAGGTINNGWELFLTFLPPPPPPPPPSPPPPPPPPTSTTPTAPTAPTSTTPMTPTPTTTPTTPTAPTLTTPSTPTIPRVVPSNQPISTFVPLPGLSAANILSAHFGSLLLTLVIIVMMF